VPSPRAKIDGLEEAVRIVRGLWSEAAFSFSGRYHRTDAADLEPKPEHHIPIWLGTQGPRALAVTGRVADGWIPSLYLAPPERIPEMRSTIFTAAEAAGRNPDDIELIYNVEVRVGGRGNLPAHVVAGDAEEVAEYLAGFTRLGFTGMNLMPVGEGFEEQVEQLGRNVVPALRATVSA
jgi:alkanesulfonate monooxygenase SsuD/methylene tetrahydromethanopterin reductase-like flavin-dependent oxidoreductase (luciferase family)